MSDDHRRTQYIFGRLNPESTDFPTLVVASPRPDGWRVRSTDRSYNHDYICYESFSDVMDWIDGDLHRPFIAIDREEVLNTMVTNSDSEHRLGFLYPWHADGPGSRGEAERALEHLERGW